MDAMVPDDGPVESLINAASEFLAALLSLVGFVGKGHRRTAIRENLELLRELDAFPDYFGKGTFAYTALADYIVLEVAKLAEIELPSKRREIPWSALVTAAILGGGTGHLTYVLNKNGFRWYSIFPGAFAALMLLGIWGMLLPQQKAPTEQHRQIPPDEAEL
jgi:hypothetical protein